jgi:VanZ family protein
VGSRYSNVTISSLAPIITLPLTHPKKNRRWIALAGLIAVLAVVVFGDLPGDSRFIDVLVNSAHAPAFALAAILLVLTSQRSEPSGSLRRYVIWWVIAVLLGAAVEMIQAIINRDADWHDVLNDAVGAAFALSMHRFIHARGTKTHSSVSLLVAGLTFTFAAWPLTECTAAYALRAHRFPSLLAVETRLDLYFVTTGDPAQDRRLTEQWPLWSSTAGPLSVELSGSAWPGLHLREVERDWSLYKAVSVDVENPGRRSLALVMRLDDRSSVQEDDPFYFDLKLPPHTRQIVKVELDGLSRPKSGKALDLHDMRALVLFHDGPVTQTMTLHEIKLISGRAS